MAVAYSSVTSVGNKGTVSYLLEDSWPRLRVVLGWCWQAEDAVEVVLSLADTHLSYADTVDKELNGLVMKVGAENIFKTFVKIFQNIYNLVENQEDMCKIENKGTTNTFKHQSLITFTRLAASSSQQTWHCWL